MTTQIQADAVAVTEDREMSAAQLDAVSAGLNKVGAGRLELSASNTYSGQTTVNQGVLN